MSFFAIFFVAIRYCFICHKWALLTYFGYYNGHEKDTARFNGHISFHLWHAI